MKKSSVFVLLSVSLGLAGCADRPLASDQAKAAPAAATAPATSMTVYKSPTCGCCGKWVDHLRDNGFVVDVVEQADLAPRKAELGVPSKLGSCHTAVVGDYVIEGHVPAGDIRRLLAERPVARGLAVPGMPIGSPGMEVGDRRDPYQVWLFGDAGQLREFARHGQPAATN